MRRWLLLLSVFMLFAVGCSADSTIDADAVDAVIGDDGDNATDDQSDDEDQDGADDEGQDGADDQGQDGADDGAEPTTAPEPTEVPESNDPGDQGATLSSNDWCTAAQEVEDQFDLLDDSGFSDPDVLERSYTSALGLIQQARLIAPPEIRDAVNTTADSLEILVAELRSADWSFIDLDLSALDGLDQELAQAGFDIEQYNFNVCGIDNGFDPNDDPSLNPNSAFDDSSDELELDGTIREQIIASFVESGFTEAEAGCLANGISDFAALADQQTLFRLFDECGLSLERLSELGG